MQATLDAFSLRSFTRALTCLSKYGEELSIYSTPDALSLSATNSSKSAYCRFKYDKQFFSRYRVGIGLANKDDWADEVEEVLTVTGQLLTKSLLSILKHRTVEKAVERCEFSIVEGVQHTGEHKAAEEDEDSLESKLIVRLYCKHGVIKTHRLLLQTPTSLMVPGMPDNFNESHLTIGPRALKDIIEHFPVSKAVKSDPQLVWTFDDSDVSLKTLESSIDSRGKGQLSTELTISADEFDVYDIFAAPTTIAFHLREFNATIAFADSMSLPLELRFTDPAAPLFIDIEGDSSETLFVISTSQVHGASNGPTDSNHEAAINKKRQRDETPAETPRIKKPMKVVQPAEPPSVAKSRPDSRSKSRSMSSMPPPPSVPMSTVPRTPQQNSAATPPPSFPPPARKDSEPLFLPSSSQLSVADKAVLRATGLGIENMDADDLAAMLEGDGEEVAFDFASQVPSGSSQLGAQETNLMDLANDGPDSFELADDVELIATQTSENSKAFQPLFED